MSRSPARVHLLVLVVTSTLVAGDLRVGVATKDMTPDRPVPLAGYSARRGRRSTGVHDHVYAKCLVIESGGVKLAWVTTDFIGINRDVRDKVLAQVSEETGIEDDHFLLCASHTHSGPGGLTKNLLWQIAVGPFDRKLYQQTISRLADLVKEADAGLAPARIGYALGRAPGLSHNRRKPGGPTDPDLGVIEVTDPDGHVRAVLANFTAHATTLGADNMLVSADYPGAFQRILSERLGGATVLFTNGAEGDQTISPPSGKDDWEQVESAGKALADEVEKTLANVTLRDSLDILGEIRERTFPLDLKTIVAPRSSTLQVHDLGGLAVIAVPGEMCVEIGLTLKKDLLRAGAKQVMIVGLSNDHLGYFVTPQYWKDGGYEKDMCFYGPTIGEFLRRRFEALWTDIHIE